MSGEAVRAEQPGAIHGAGIFSDPVHQVTLMLLFGTPMQYISLSPISAGPRNGHLMSPEVILQAAAGKSLLINIPW